MRELNIAELAFVCGGTTGTGGTATAGPSSASATCPAGTTPVAIQGGLGGSVSYGPVSVSINGEGSFATCL